MAKQFCQREREREREGEREREIIYTNRELAINKTYCMYFNRNLVHF